MCWRQLYAAMLQSSSRPTFGTFRKVHCRLTTSTQCTQTSSYLINWICIRTKHCFAYIN